MARPVKPASEQLYNFSVRLSIADRAKIEREARKAGLCRSEYIRRCTLRGTVRIVHERGPVDPDLRRNLLAIGNNLNQIARRLNMTGLRPAHLDATLDILNDLIAQAGEPYDC